MARNEEMERRKMGGFIFLNEETRDGPLKTLALMALDHVGATAEMII